MPTRYLLVLTTFLLSMLCYVDRVCISTAKESVAGDLGLSETQWGWVLSSFALGYALFQTPSGMLADRYGPRRILTAVVLCWSIFTGLTGLMRHFWTLVIIRFFFGAGEAGAFPNMARAIYSWLPMSERGIAHGVNFSGSRLGAAFALPMVAWMIDKIGWRVSFLILGGIGFVWASAWYYWFRDDPIDHEGISEQERQFILSQRQQDSDASTAETKVSFGCLMRSGNVWLLMSQYFASNFTFFFCLGWLYPYLKEKYELALVEAGWYAMVPLLFGALGNWTSGVMVDLLYKRGHWQWSRRLPALIGFVLAAVGLVASTETEHLTIAVAWLSVSIFGADMTLSPSWTACTDIGRRQAGTVSGTMNMAGNLGAFLTALAFPYLLKWTGSTTPFFYVGAVLNIMAVFAWILIRTDQPLEEV